MAYVHLQHLFTSGWRTTLCWSKWRIFQAADFKDQSDDEPAAHGLALIVMAFHSLRKIIMKWQSSLAFCTTLSMPASRKLEN